MQNQTIFELYADNNQSSSNSKNILKPAKKIYEKIYTEQTSTTATTEFLSKISNRKKISNEHFLREAEISLDEIIKSINSETNNKSPGNDGLTAEFYKHFSNELAPVLLDVYDSWGKLTSRTGIKSAIYKKGDKEGDKKDIAN